MSAAAERLQAEEAVLTARAEEIGRPLEHYDAVDRSGVLVGVLFKDGGRSAVRGPTRLSVNDDRERYVAVLEQIDAAVEFFGGDGGGVEAFGRPGSAGGSAGGGRGGGRTGRGGTRYAAAQPYDPRAGGSAEYYRRACALQDAALELLRVGVADRISQTSSQVQDALNLPRVPIAADKLEASLVYTRFHGISRRSNALLSVAKDRLDALGPGSVASSSYEDLMSLCRGSYCAAREALLTSTVRTHMDTLRERHGLVGMTRLASVFLIRLCNVETALYLDFFGDPSRRQQSRRRLSVDEGDGGNDEEQAASEGGPALRRLGSTASASASRAALSDDPAFRDAEFQSCLGSLCSALHRTVRRGLVSVLDLDVLCQVVSVLREERTAANASPVTTAAARAVSGVIQDAQERLIFCANSSLHREVVKFRPGGDDLDYPRKLLPPGEKANAGAIVIDDGEGTAEEEEGKAPDGRPDGASAPPSEPAGGVDDAVAAQLKVYEGWFPPMRSVLRILSKIFRVVEPRVFEDIALSAVQSCTKSLKDGSVQIYRRSGLVHADLFLVKHLLILREQLSPFDLQLRSVERQLDFTEAGRAVTRFLANRNRRLFSMSNENALVTLLREGVSVQESSVDSKRDLEDCLRSACNDFIEHTTASLLGPVFGLVDKCKDAGPEALPSAPFMAAAAVRDVLAGALGGLEERLDGVRGQMRLYLESGATEGILLRPVVKKLTRAVEDVKKSVSEVPNGENGWDAEIRAEVNGIADDFIEVATRPRADK